MTNLFLWVKVVHIVSVIAWMAGMLYLPRLFVYHAEVPSDSEPAEVFVVMERRLMRFIMLPALFATWISGLYLALNAGLLPSGWLHAKLALVMILTGMHGYFGRLRKDFVRKSNRHSPVFYRAINEAPTILMVGIVILVVVKPF